MNARDSGIELLRIVLMLFIIIWHYLVYGQGVLENFSKNELFTFITPVLVLPVDCFIFITGYYGLKLNRFKFISFVGMLITYSVSIYLITSLIKGSFDLKMSIISLFPISTNYWWFFTQYMMLMILSPILNFCDNFDKAYFEKVLILIAFFYLGIMSLLMGQKVGCIGDLTLFIFIYLLGRYLYKYPVKILIEKRFVLFILLYVLSGLLLLLFLGVNAESWILRLVSYNNPIIVFMAIEFFYIFKKIKIGKCEILNLVGSTVFASYIITESSIRYYYINFVTNYCGNNLFYYILFSLITILLIFPFELLRRKISNRLLCKITEISYTYIR